MLSHADNEKMCRVGPGTSMGNVLRRFWLPVMQSSELPQGGDEPVLLELLGEKLVAFRNAEGEPGVLSEFCCHRGASLGLGRVEECGVRCIYHGWLFAPDGKVLETPNVNDSRFKDRIRQPAFPVREAGGLIWTFLGDPNEIPAFPDFPWLDATEEDRVNICVMVDANFVQVMEGLLDSSHLSILHSSGLAKADQYDSVGARKAAHMIFDAAPRIEAEATDWGFMYAALRSVGGKQEARVAAFISPLFILNPNGDLWFAVVPINDERTAFFHIFWEENGRYRDAGTRAATTGLTGLDSETLERFGMTRATHPLADPPSRENRWNQDRAAMRNGHFSGLTSFTLEDAIVAMSAGAVRDRTIEHLATPDLAIGNLYRALLRNVAAVEAGRQPAAIEQRIGHLRGGSEQMAEGDDWRTIVSCNYGTPSAEAKAQAI